MMVKLQDLGQGINVTSGKRDKFAKENAIKVYHFHFLHIVITLWAHFI